MKTLLIIDTNALIHRAFHALPPFTSPAGEPTGALYGLASTLLKVLREEPPDYLAAVFDRPEPTFRKEIYKEYKAQRPAAPDALVAQIIEARRLLENFSVKIFEKPGLEADDIIGTLAEKFKSESDLKIVILTGDLDTLQLVEGEKVVVRTLKKGVSETIVYDERAVKERYGLLPSQLIDYKSLVGDPSDNIPGVPGIGPKTASQIFSKYQSLDQLYKNIEEEGLELTPAKERKLLEKLLEHKEKALMAKKLVTIERRADIEAELNDLIYKEPRLDALKNYFQELGFQSLIQRLDRTEIEKTSESANKSEESELASDRIMNAGFDFKARIKGGQKSKEPFFDLGIAAWLVDPDLKDYSPQNLARKFLKKDFGDEREIAAPLHGFLSKKLKEYGLGKIFWEIEMPLIKILAEMEKTGIGADTAVLRRLEEELGGEIKELEEKIYRELGETFNLNSPKQLVEVLNRKFNLKLFSTAAEKMEALKDRYPAIGLILEYREDFKIKSAFAEPLIKLMAADGRLRTTFNQTGAATGRLSSSEPNLQNVPQESKWAGKLRAAFIPAPGFKLVSFDYSQLELRILASVSGDEKLKQAFFEGRDIHKLTAAQVFNAVPENVTSEMRRLGKTLNFGVVYGMGADAFSRASGLKKDEARKFIDEYFADFPAVREWQEKTKQEARTFGYVSNLNGRRRWLFNIADFNPRLQAEAERIAINMPIQSLEADIIKLAMIKAAELLEKNRWTPAQARLLLSIHDELLFEIGDDILKEAAEPIKKIMESVYPLAVPLIVDVKIGPNWGEMRDEKLESTI